MRELVAARCRAREGRSHQQPRIHIVPARDGECTMQVRFAKNQDLPTRARGETDVHGLPEESDATGWSGDPRVVVNRGVL